MEAKARLVGVATDWISKRLRLTFEIIDREIEPSLLEGRDLRLKAAIWRNKRSLDSNAYFHLLVGKIAEKTQISFTEAKNHLLAEYGQPMIQNGTLMQIIMLDEIEWQKLETMHVRPTSAIRILDNGKLYRVYYMMRGSHTYDSAEMSRLISGTVQEAKELGIETATPDELAHMAEMWEKSEKKHLYN